VWSGSGDHADGPWGGDWWPWGGDDRGIPVEGVSSRPADSTRACHSRACRQPQVLGEGVADQDRPRGSAAGSVSGRTRRSARSELGVTVSVVERALDLVLGVTAPARVGLPTALRGRARRHRRRRGTDAERGGRGGLFGDRVPGSWRRSPCGDGPLLHPLAEVPFCGHATIASAVAHAERHGPGTLRYATMNGPVEVGTAAAADGVLVATLVSVPPRTVDLSAADLDEILAALRWSRTDLDAALPTRVAFAGAWHPIVAAATRMRLADLDYDFPRLGALMAARDWTTVALVHRESSAMFHARNPFPPAGTDHRVARSGHGPSRGADRRHPGGGRGGHRRVRHRGPPPRGLSHRSPPLGGGSQHVRRAANMRCCTLASTGAIRSPLTQGCKARNCLA
jgi:Phenazine biosynthesis-like protein